MTSVKIKTYADFILPPSVVSKVDVSRLASELEKIDSAMSAAVVRAKAGASDPGELGLTQRLTDFIELNKLNLTAARERSDLLTQLRLLKDKVPVVHLTFAVPADSESLQKLAAWLRASVHPQAVIAVGLQPALVAGVYVRTPNHVHDLSVRGLLAAQHDNLVGQLETLRGVK